MEQMLLREKSVPPDPRSLTTALAGAYPVFVQLVEAIGHDEYGITGSWNYYNDGKAWLYKATSKKKTIFWLSVWEGCFRVGFYFNEKNGDGIYGLSIDPALKESFEKAAPIGKLRPLTIIVRQIAQLNDLFEVIKYKQSCK